MLHQHLVEYFTRSDFSTHVVEQSIRELRPDGSWPDINYDSQQRGSWQTYSHLGRLEAMARAYRSDGSPWKGSAKLRDATLLALNHWLQEDYRNPNWWYGRIGVPRAIAPVLLLLEDQVPVDTREIAIKQILDRSQMGMTGQNKVWIAGINLMKGLLIEDLALIQTARNAIISELRITTAEGIQPDFSFHQHGPQQQWGNYGGSFGSDMLQWAAILRDTGFAFSESEMKTLHDYLLEGPAWIVWRGQMDISGCGRQVVPGCQESKGSSLLRQLRSLRELEPTNSATIDRFLTCQVPTDPNLLVGHKHFWRSDISVHRRPDWYASVKMSSTRVIGAETCNSENLLGLHLGDGAMYVHRTGQEYRDLFPVWDWRRLPGTTCLQSEESLVPGTNRCRGASDFVGGVSDGEIGLAAMEYRRDGLHVNKAWFFLEDSVICLGAGISCDQPDEVVTSLEQSRLAGPVTVSRRGTVQQLQRGSFQLEDVEWIHHAGVGYRFFRPTAIHVDCERKAGDWRRVHDQDRGVGPAQADVFSTWISHGAEPDGDSYAYAVFPDTTAESMNGQSMPAILQQTKLTLAIAAQGRETILAAFFSPGDLSIDDLGAIEVDQPCLAIVDRTSAPNRVFVADPTHKMNSLKIRWKTAGDSGEEISEARCPLPRDGQAGSTIAVPLSIE